MAADWWKGKPFVKWSMFICMSFAFQLWQEPTQKWSNSWIRVITSSLCRCGSWDTEGLDQRPKVTQLPNVRAGTLRRDHFYLLGHIPCQPKQGFANGLINGLGCISQFPWNQHTDNSRHYRWILDLVIFQVSNSEGRRGGTNRLINQAGIKPRIIKLTQLWQSPTQTLQGPHKASLWMQSCTFLSGLGVRDSLQMYYLRGSQASVHLNHLKSFLNSLFTLHLPPAILM